MSAGRLAPMKASDLALPKAVSVVVRRVVVMAYCVVCMMVYSLAATTGDQMD